MLYLVYVFVIKIYNVNIIFENWLFIVIIIVKKILNIISVNFSKMVGKIREEIVYFKNVLV